MQFFGIGVDLADLTLITGKIERDALIHIPPQQLTRPCCDFGREKIGTHILGTDRVGLCLLKIFALIVAGHGHRETESNDETKERHSRGSDHVKICPLFLLDGAHLLAN